MSFGQHSRITVAMIGLALLSGCTLHDSNSYQRAPVEVRRGDHYGKPVYRQPEGQGMPAPTLNRPVYPANRPQVDQEQAPVASTGEQSVPAVGRLLARAEDQIRQENYAGAAASAESALRLDPQSVKAYHALARTYLFERRYGESEQMALRAVSLLRSKGLTSNQQMSRDLWLLIAETRRQRGDQQGAERAVQQAGGRY